MKKRTTSKSLLVISILQFLIIIGFCCYCILEQLDLSIFAYLVPASSALAVGAAGFYFNKAKAENLSKQRIRYVYLKLLLQDKLDPQTYEEIEEELSNIDDIINDKIKEDLSCAINEDANF